MVTPAFDPPPARRIAGRVLSVDASNRLIRVRSGADSCLVRVPPGCEVWLNDEPIRLRLLEAGDPVEVEAVEGDAELTAVAVRGGR